MSGPAMRRFWDRRAEEDAYFFVDSRRAYRDPEARDFWQRGEQDLETLLGSVAATLSPSDRVVEIGCGVGRMTRAIAARAASVEALDVSERMLARARSLNPSLANVTWVLGDGRSLGGIASESADTCISHVVFQHIPDPAITLGYVSEMGRVLHPGGWAAFQISNDPVVHRPRPGDWLRSLPGRGPRGRQRRYWRGSHIELDALRATAEESSMTVERVVGEGTQFCAVLLRRR